MLIHDGSIKSHNYENIYFVLFIVVEHILNFYLLLNMFFLYRNLLLGSKGIDLPQLSQKLESLSTRKTFEPLDPVPDNDIHSYLKNEAENAILTLIDSTHKRVIQIPYFGKFMKSIFWDQDYSPS